MQRTKIKSLKFIKHTITHYKVLDKKDRYICDIKKLRVGQYYHWCMGPHPVVDNIQGKTILHYNIFYTKNQMLEMCDFISARYTEDIKRLKEERQKERDEKYKQQLYKI